MNGHLRVSKAFSKSKSRIKPGIFFYGVVNDAINQTYIFTNKPAFDKSCLVIVDEFWESSLDSVCD